MILCGVIRSLEFNDENLKIYYNSNTSVKGYMVEEAALKLSNKD